MRQSVSHTESYSIDEQFLYLDGYEKHHDTVGLMKDMVRKIALWTDIPVSVGIASTKTLAKVANKYAKKYKYDRKRRAEAQGPGRIRVVRYLGHRCQFPCPADVFGSHHGFGICRQARRLGAPSFP